MSNKNFTEVEVDALPTEEEAKAMHMTLKKHINRVRHRMVMQEDKLMQSPMLNDQKIADMYREAEHLTKLYNWLSGIEYNRYVYPLEVLKAQAAQKEQSKKGMHIIAEA